MKPSMIISSDPKCQHRKTYGKGYCYTGYFHIPLYLIHIKWNSDYWLVGFWNSNRSARNANFSSCLMKPSLHLHLSPKDKWMLNFLMKSIIVPTSYYLLIAHAMKLFEAAPALWMFLLVAWSLLALGILKRLWIGKTVSVLSTWILPAVKHEVDEK
jgi:hypothetical protein